MTTSFEQLLTDCLVALGDSSGATWDRTTRMWQFCIEAMLTFPILRPMQDDHTNGANTVYYIALPEYFRDVISVEYPDNQTPQSFLVRKNHLDPDFYLSAGYYDVDRAYDAGSGWNLYVSGGIAPNAHIITQYLANHDTDMADDEQHLLSIPDEYVNILISKVMCRAYRERLSFAMQNPTANTNVIAQLVDMVDKQEAAYQALVNSAQLQLTQSKISPRHGVDKFDRVY